MSAELIKQFFVLLPSDSSRDDIIARTEFLASEHSGIPLFPEIECHFTILHFLARFSDTDIIKNEISSIIENIFPIKISFDGLWFYYSTNRKSDGIAWRIHKDEKLLNLRKYLADSLLELNIPLEFRFFDNDWLPHICAVSNIEKSDEEIHDFDSPFGEFIFDKLEYSLLDKDKNIEMITSWQLR